MAGGLLAGCAGPKHDSATPASPSPVTGAGTAASPPPGADPSATVSAARPPVSRAQIVARYGRSTPHTWGFDAPGVVHSLPSTTRDIALTFDACGGPGGSGYDRALIEFLRTRHIPATLFINSRWIDANPAQFRRLAADPLFEIANHGTRHRPLSVTGRSAYGIPGTRGAGEVYDEIAGNRAKLTRLLGAPPRFFRSGTAYCDDVAARIVGDLGERFVSFSVNGDGGATFTAEQVHTTVASARAGSIVLCHMNHPEGGTARGIATAVPHLLADGHRFVRLSQALHRS
ncbi:polysaccharide deacetylase family protein [Streptomyces sp. NPDC052109]|uniref:polysaccharide deacetylase family protein n=1 Tax=Streptomyces sp. NPDC052109 TaxID=3155527 RepID=UPI0034316F5B